MDIRVFDNFLTDDEMKVLEEYFTGSVWKWGHKSSDNARIQKWFSAELDDKPYFTEYLKEKIERNIDIKCELVRVYANGQTILNGGSWHSDINLDGYLTALLYVSNITRHNVDVIRGHTEFMSENGNITSIQPIKNRLVVFDSQILHQGCAPDVPGFLRISVAWKLKRIK